MKSKTPTKAESRRMERVKTIGCIVCGSAPSQCHHLLSGGRRRGHMFTIGLCPKHHTDGAVSYDGSKKRFQALYGYDDELLAKQDDLLDEFAANTVGGA